MVDVGMCSGLKIGLTPTPFAKPLGRVTQSLSVISLYERLLVVCENQGGGSLCAVGKSQGPRV
jgi:hypothetical protein